MLRFLLSLLVGTLLLFANDVTEMMQYFEPSETVTQHIDDEASLNPGFEDCQRLPDQKHITCFNDFLCMERKNYLEAALGSGQSVEDAFAEITRADPKMIAFGERHYLQNTTEDYSNILASLKNDRAKLDCLFLEIPDTPAEKRAIEAITKAFPDGTYEKGFMGPTLHGKIQTMINRGEIPKDSKLPISRWIPLVMKAIELGIKILPVDHPRTSAGFERTDLAQGNPRWGTTVEGLNTRDSYMDRQVRDHLEGANAQCQRGIGFFGKAHLTDSKPKRQTLGKRLGQGGFGLNINIQATGKFNDYLIGSDKFYPDFQWTWPVCRQHPNAPDVTTVVSFAKSGSPLSMNLNGLGNWRDFDYHIIYPVHTR